MTDKNINTHINTFIKNYNLLKEELSLEKIQSILRHQGFDLLYYNHYSNTEEIDFILNTFKLKELSIHTSCFTYADDNNKIIFILEHLTSADELSLLLHEEGHIFLEHFFKDGILNNTSV